MRRYSSTGYQILVAVVSKLEWLQTYALLDFSNFLVDFNSRPASNSASLKEIRIWMDNISSHWWIGNCMISSVHPSTKVTIHIRDVNVLSQETSDGPVPSQGERRKWSITLFINISARVEYTQYPLRVQQHSSWIVTVDISNRRNCRARAIRALIRMEWQLLAYDSALHLDILSHEFRTHQS